MTIKIKNVLFFAPLSLALLTASPLTPVLGQQSTRSTTVTGILIMEAIGHIAIHRWIRSTRTTSANWNWPGHFLQKTSARP